MTCLIAAIALTTIPVRVFRPGTRWTYEVELESKGTERSFEAKYRFEIRHIGPRKPNQNEKPDTDKTAAPVNASVLLYGLDRTEEDTPDVHLDKFGVASWNLTERGMPGNLTITGVGGVYLIQALCFFLPASVDTSDRFSETIKFVDGLSGDVTGVVRQERKFSMVESDWKIQQGKLHTVAKFDDKGKLIDGSCHVDMGAAKSDYKVRLR